MVTVFDPLREQLLDRRQKLEVVVGAFYEAPEITRLLREVDTALQRMDDGTYGLCDLCHEPVETDRLIADPLTRLCIGHLSEAGQRALEDDLQLAAQIQKGLLPRRDYKIDGWDISYYYRPAGLVSGDYCDLISTPDDSLYFILGDVSGKGVAASMLMAHLQALFRSLTSIDLPLDQLLERASRVFCESTLPTHYATLICGKAKTTGELEICNAGHLPALLVQGSDVARIDSSGLPVGVFCSEHFTVETLQIQKSETIVLYTDGLSETRDGFGNEYGIERLANLLSKNSHLSPEALIDVCVRDVNRFGNGDVLADDLTIMAIQRRP
jgi:sigma-B regulation protein RsbU (phosphoserine phosphatase)